MKKTIKQFCEYSSIDAGLIRAVIRQSGGWLSFQKIAPDIINHGISGGFSGWIYYTETCAFYAKNQSLIVELVESQSDEYGYRSAQDMVNGFRSLDATLSEIAYTLYCKNLPHDIQVANALAWFAAEEVARAYNDWVNYGE